MSSSEPPRSIAGQLFNLALPIVGLNVLSVITLAVDTAMCGRLENAEVVLKALGFATQVVFLLMVAMIGLLVGTVALVARAHGAKQEEQVNHLVAQSTMFTFLVSAFVAVVGWFTAGPIIDALGASGEASQLAVTYLRPLLIFSVFYYLNMLLGAVLRAVGNTKLPFFVALGSNALNVVLNYGLILGGFGWPKLGVAGAAWATVISYAFAVVVTIALLRRGVQPGVTFPLRPRALDAELGRRLFRIGVPAAFDMVVLNAAFLSIIGMLGRLEEVAVAAHGVGLRVQALAFVPGLGVSQATGAMVGNALGAGNVAKAREVVRAAIFMSVAIMLSLGAAIILGERPLLALFDIHEGTRLFSLSAEWMRLLGYGMPIVGIHMGFIGMFRGAGATNTSLLVNVIGTVAIQIPLSWFLGFPMGLGTFGVWAGFPLSFFAKAALGMYFYRRGQWAKTGATV